MAQSKKHTRLVRRFEGTVLLAASSHFDLSFRRTATQYIPVCFSTMSSSVSTDPATCVETGDCLSKKMRTLPTLQLQHDISGLTEGWRGNDRPDSVLKNVGKVRFELANRNDYLHVLQPKSLHVQFEEQKIKIHANHV